MWHQTCKEGKRLLDAYVMALSNEEAIKFAARSGDVTLREARAVQDLLNAARNRYWAHVTRHKCRVCTERSSSVDPTWSLGEVLKEATNESGPEA